MIYLCLHSDEAITSQTSGNATNEENVGWPIAENGETYEEEEEILALFHKWAFINFQHVLISKLFGFIPSGTLKARNVLLCLACVALKKV